MPVSSNSMSSYVPGVHSTAWSRPCLLSRLSTPRVTSVDEPSGATSHSRAMTWARGVLLSRRSRTRGRPRISTRSVSGSESKQTERPSSSRWSGGRSLALPKGKKRPASRPVCCGERTTTGSALAPRGRESQLTCWLGHLASPTQRPGSTSYDVAGGTGSVIQARSRGSAMAPVSMPLRCWSHQRRVSWRKPMAGPGGRPRSGYWCDHGPTMPRTRSSGRCSTSRNTASRYGSFQPPTARTAASMAV